VEPWAEAQAEGKSAIITAALHRRYLTYFGNEIFSTQVGISPADESSEGYVQGKASEAGGYGDPRSEHSPERSPSGSLGRPICKTKHASVGTGSTMQAPHYRLN